MASRTRTPDQQAKLDRANAAASGTPILATPATPAVAKAAKTPKVGSPCLCGCGILAKAGSRFLPGHDARLKGQLLKVQAGTMSLRDINPEAVALLRVRGVASFRLSGDTLTRVGPLALLADARAAKVATPAMAEVRVA